MFERYVLVGCAVYTSRKAPVIVISEFDYCGPECKLVA